MSGILVIIGFAAVMAAINYGLRRLDRDGSFDTPGGSAARPGLRLLLDYGADGFARDGLRQRVTS